MKPRRPKITREQFLEYHRVYAAEWRRKNPERNKQNLKNSRDRNRKEINEKSREYLKLKRKLHPEIIFFYRMKHSYGLSREEYEKMVIDQNNSCAICSDSFKEKIKPFVDHDHVTKKVRGLVCTHCNRGLGAFKDDPTNLSRAIVYLMKSGISK